MDLETIAWTALGVGAVYYLADGARADSIHEATNSMLAGALYKLMNDRVPQITEESYLVIGPASYKARQRYEKTLAAIAKIGPKEIIDGQKMQELWDIK